MKTLIYQYYYSLPKGQHTYHIMKDENQYYEYSRQSICKYAKEKGHDYKFLNQRHEISPFYGIFLPFTEGWCKDYDAICWMDADILATQNAQDIFSQYDSARISAYFMKTQDRWENSNISESCGWFKNKGHINSGVVIFPKSVYKFITNYVQNLQHLHDTQEKLEASLGHFDQAIVNKIVKELDSYNQMCNHWNYHLGRYPHQDRFDTNLIHYWRKYKTMLIEDFKDERIMK